MPVLEHALLPVRAGQEAAFETAMAEARPLIAASPGFLAMELRRPADGGSTYLLLVHWQSINDHRDGFRKSDRYRTWRALLHGFYDPMPEVRYFADDLPSG